MDDSLNTFGKVCAWGTVVAIGVATTFAAVWLIRNPQIASGTPWEGVIRHPGFIITAAVATLLPWWSMVFCAIDADRNRASRRDSDLKGPADWLSVMQADRKRHEKHW